MNLPGARLGSQLQRITGALFYGDMAFLIKRIGTGVYDANNTETVTTIEIPLECSFSDKDKMSSEAWRDYADIGQVDAEIRFVGHDPSKGDRVKLVSRFEGNSHSNDTFEIVGIRNRYTFGYVCALRAVKI